MDSDRIDVRPVSQENFSIEQATQELVPLLRGLNELVALTLRYATDPKTARMLARLIAAGADGIFIPDSGSGNISLLSTLLNRDHTNVRNMLKREQIPTTKPGSEKIIRFSDINPKPEEEAKSAGVSTPAA